jgi:hypothetical protein
VPRELFRHVRQEERAETIRSGLAAGFPSSYVRDLRPLTAIPLLAGDTPSLHPGMYQECPPLGSIRCPTMQFVPVGYPFSGLHGALRGTRRYALRADGPPVPTSERSRGVPRTETASVEPAEAPCFASGEM